MGRDVNCHDVLVVGSGPAGASAAHFLAAGGMKVALLEKHDLPRYKTCGGGVVYRALRLLPFDIHDAVERHCHRAELNMEMDNLHFSTVRQKPIVTMTMRERFDFGIVEAARKEGAKVYSRCSVIDVQSGREQVELATNRGPFRGRFVVAADGAMSSVARCAGWGRIRHHLMPALECEVQIGDKEHRKFSEAARFDFAAVPCGYGWVFPKHEHLSIGVLNSGRSRLNLNRSFDGYLNRVGISSVKSIERHGFVIPVGSGDISLVKNRVILTGDAAGLADPITGEGITFAIRSGQLAADALLKGDLRQEAVGRIYSHSVSSEILSELRWGRALAKLTYGSSRLRSFIFSRYGQKLCEAMTDVLMGERTYGEMVRDPRNYLKLLTTVPHG